MKYSLYKKSGLRRKMGHIDISASQGSMGISAKQRGKLIEEFARVLCDFIEKKHLIVVSNEASFRKHHHHKKYNKKTQLLRDIYFKTINPRTGRLEFKKLK